MVELHDIYIAKDKLHVLCDNDLTYLLYIAPNFML